MECYVTSFRSGSSISFLWVASLLVFFVVLFVWSNSLSNSPIPSGNCFPLINGLKKQFAGPLAETREH